MANFFETVLTVLKSDERFVAEDGTFLRNAVYEAAMKMDAKLIRLLLENEETCTRFFKDVDGVKVFDKTGFAWVINNRQFLPDSYTRYKNRIGLADERGELISASGDVELVFPYKDCVLEGGQTKDEQKRSEIFYNGNLAPDQVDRLLYPKTLVNARKYENGVELKKGKKPEKLVARIVKLCTNEGDIVLDFFAGSGTTGAVALKMNRHFIICEQMDYIETITCDRLRNTVDGDSRGISADVDWQGGGSFVYCELAKLNQAVVEDIEAAADDETLAEIYERMMKSGFISYKVNPSDIEAAADDYADLSLDDKKRFLIEILDKNLLYVNYCDIDDEEFGVSEEDKAFTRSFYREG